MSDRVPMTTLGYARLKEELKHRKSVERPRISKEIEVARAHGDLKENAEYHAAKEKQGFVEGRIMEIESKLSLADVIDPTTLSGEKVMFGAHVTLMDENEKEVTYQIVGVDEADMKVFKISVTAPLSRAMIGKRIGEDFELKMPKGDRGYEIIGVEYRS